MEGESSVSKVSVEYYDPSGVYPLVAKQLAAHLPLHDLNWKSTTRPLRSISSLHIEFLAAQDLERPVSRHGPSSTEYGSPVRNPAERRHQIPGLRQTPYLKVFLLRCDDSETYKSTARKALREWLKTHTPASQSSSARSSQENHDAFEWLILHVVLPNTQAASQARSSGSASKSDNTANEKAGTSSKILGRSSSTLLEKIKADFNVSSKSAPDRVEQLRLTIDDLPASIVPANPTGTSDWVESAQDNAHGWQELLNKLKTLILSSFSLRVSQYEDDIRERDAQRTLPGWNFCTFFMLKEGLLRGFESVGLVDDALIGYDELSLGLSNLSATVNEDGTTARSDSFLKYTKEMKDILLQCLTSDSTPDVVWESNTEFVSTTRKDYRSLIVNSNVSRFDFESYIFARQMAILLRISSPESNNVSQGRAKRPQELAALSELCQRATSFIAEASRILKAELIQAAEAQGIESPPSTIENIVSSFSFAVAEQILIATNVPELQQSSDDANAVRLHQNIDRLQHPERRSSLPVRAPPSPARDDPLTMLKQLEVKSSAHHRPEDDFSMVQVSELDVLAGHRTDLLMLERQVLEKVAQKRSWLAGTARISQFSANGEADLTDVDLTGDDQLLEPAERIPDASSLQGVLHASMLEALSSMEDFRNWFESLTSLALSQCVLALRLKTAERLCADLAVLRFDAEDYSTALSYLTTISPSFTDKDWNVIEAGLTDISLKCLKSLNRRDNYVRLALSALSKSASRRKSALKMRQRVDLTADESVTELLQDVLDVSAALPHEVVAPMSDFFDNITIDPYIKHFVDKDGFSVTLSLRLLLGQVLPIDRIRLKIKCIEPPSRELWLEDILTEQLEPGTNQLELGIQAVCFGTFAVEKVFISAKKIRFEAEMRRLSSFSFADDRSDNVHSEGSFLTRLPQILCYPSETNFAASVTVSRQIHVNKTRLLEIRLSTGRNVIQNGQLNLRAASAGLRLKTAEAFVADSGIHISKGKEVGVLDLSNLEKQTSIIICLPYDLESSLSQISISLDFHYTTAHGTFHFMSNPSVAVDLALDVSVHDLFRKDVLFSRFQIKASREVPLLIASVALNDSDHYTVEAPPSELTPMIVLPQQDGVLLYKIAPKLQFRNERQTVKTEQPLRLSLKYHLLDELIFVALQKSLKRAINGSPFMHLAPLLLATLQRISQSLTIMQMEETAMLRQFPLPDYVSMGWNELLGGLHPSKRQELSSLLKTWQDQTPTVDLDVLDEVIGDEQPQLHAIDIDVPLPRIHILHTARMVIPDTGFISQGSVVTAKVLIEHTCRWEAPSTMVSAIGSSDSQRKFALEIDAPPDVWLLGGDRRTSFESVEGQVMSFELLLVPLKTGRLLLPEISVRWAGPIEEDVRCETDYQSASGMVMVVADVQSVTVGVEDIAAGTEIALVASERWSGSTRV